MNVVELAPIVKSLEVKRNPAEAFRLFTEEMTAWWPIATHSMAKDAAGEKTECVIFEPRVGGRIFERLNTGAERNWGEVLVYEKGKRIAFLFQLGRPREKSGAVEVRFEPSGEGACRVTLTHAGWERMGADAVPMRGRFDKGWDEVFVAGFGRFSGRT